MLHAIAENPFMFIVLVAVLVLLHLGALIRMRHEANLKKRNHGERRRRPRITPNTKGARKRRKK